MLKLRPLLYHATRDRSPRVIAAPDGLLHPRFAARRTGEAVWVSLRRDAVQRAPNAKRWLANLTGGPPKINDNIMAQVGAELEERCAQELELLRARIMSAKPPSSFETEAEESFKGRLDAVRVLRPLEPSEVEAVARGVAPERAIAILDVWVGKSPLAEEEGQQDQVHVPMIRRAGSTPGEGEEQGDVPVFPLHALLGGNPRIAALVQDVLAAERAFARRCAQAGDVKSSGTTEVGAEGLSEGAEASAAAQSSSTVPDGTEEVEQFRQEQDAFLVAVQTPDLDVGADAGVALVVALWRVALWRGEGWEIVKAAEKELREAEAAKAKDKEGGGEGEGSGGKGE